MSQSSNVYASSSQCPNGHKLPPTDGPDLLFCPYCSVPLQRELYGQGSHGPAIVPPVLPLFSNQPLQEADASTGGQHMAADERRDPQNFRQQAILLDPYQQQWMEYVARQQQKVREQSSMDLQGRDSHTAVDNDHHSEETASQESTKQKLSAKCLSCGTELVPGARFCANRDCGKSIIPRNTPCGPPCHYCKKLLIKPSAKRCDECGRDQPGTPTEPSQTSPNAAASPPPGFGHENPQQPCGPNKVMPYQHSEGLQWVSAPCPESSAQNSSMVFGQSAPYYGYNPALVQSGNVYPGGRTFRPVWSSTSLPGVPMSARPTRGAVLPQAGLQQSNQAENSTYVPSGGNNLNQLKNLNQAHVTDQRNNSGRESNVNSSQQPRPSPAPAGNKGNTTSQNGSGPGSTVSSITSGDSNKKSYAAALTGPKTNTTHSSSSEMVTGSAATNQVKVYNIVGLECNDPQTTMKLVFHAIVPLAYWEWDNDSRICIRFGHDKLGKWNVDCGEFEMREIDDLYSEVMFAFDKFDAKLLDRNASIPYKYFIYSPKSKSDDDRYEFLHGFNYHGEIVNRCIKLSSKPTHGCYHKYDTIVYPKKIHVSQSWRKSLASFASTAASKFTSLLGFDLKKETSDSKDKEELKLTPLSIYEMSVFCLEYYLGMYKDMVIHGNFHPHFDVFKSANEVRHVHSSMQNFFVFAGGVSIMVTVPQVNVFREEIKKWLKSLLDHLEKNPLQEPGMQLVAGFFILVCFGKTYKLYQQLKNELILALVRILTFRSYPDRRLSFDYEFLLDTIRDKNPSLIKDVAEFLSQLYKKVAEMKNVSPLEWMKALPLHHFLAGASKPYGRIDISADFATDHNLGLFRVKSRIENMERFVTTIYDDLKLYLELDPLLYQVFMYLTPEHEFPAMCERVPISLSAVWLVKEVKEIRGVSEKDEVSWSAKLQCIKNILHHNRGTEELLIVANTSYELFNKFAKLKKSSQHIVSLLRNTITLFLHTVEKLDGATASESDWQQKARAKVFDNVKKALRSWIIDKDVIGGEDVFGGTVNATNSSLKKELRIWNEMLTVDTHEEHPSQAVQSWQSIIWQIVEQRLRSVKQPNMKITIVRLTDEMENISPVLTDVIMRAGYKAIDILCDKAKSSDLESLAERESRNVGILLGHILQRRYPHATERERISFNDLLAWHMWPIFISIYVSKPKLWESIPEDYHIAGACAQSCLEKKYEELQSGEITYEDLKKIEEHSEKMKQLCVALSRREESIYVAVRRRLEEYSVFKNCRQQYEHLCRNLRSAGKVQGLAELETELKNDVKNNPISTLCIRDENDCIQLVCFSSAGSLHKFAAEFYVVSFTHGNDLFLCIWKSSLNKAVTSNSQLSLGDVFSLVWEPCLEKCKQLLQSLRDLSMKLSDVDTILKPYEIQRSLETCLSSLFKGINDVSCLAFDHRDIEVAARRIRNYWGLRQYQRSANAILEVKRCLGLQGGNFQSVEKLSQQLSVSMENQTLLDVDDSLVDASKFLKDIAKDSRKMQCLEKFAQCQKIVKWLKDVTKDVTKETKEVKNDVNEIQRFVQVALATAAGGEGDLFHDKLSNLSTVGSGYSSLIYNLPENAGFVELKKACLSVWDALSKNEKLPKLLEECNADVGYYQSVKETQGSVEVTSYGQMRNILRYGRYHVGVETQSKAVHGIRDIISLKLLTSEPLPKYSYSLEDLRDLESKLVLITGSKSDDRMEVDHFLNILQHVTRIAEALLALQQAGNIAYSGWMMAFDCAAYTVIVHGEEEKLKLRDESASKKVAALFACAKRMEDALKEWEQEITESRSRHYELNYYTALQLLRIRRELSQVRQNQSRYVDAEILALLESISPEVTQEHVNNAVSSLERNTRSLNFTSLAELSSGGEVHTESLRDESTSSIHTIEPDIDQIHSQTDPQPSPSIVSFTDVRKYNDNPRLRENDLNDDQKVIFSNLVEYAGYSRMLVLKAFEECPDTDDEYDIQAWCDENDETFKFDDSEENMSDNKDLPASDDDSSDASSDSDEDKGNVFDQSAQPLAASRDTHNGTAGDEISLSSVVEVVYKPVVNESHPVVQQLIEEEYDLDQSIEAVQLFETLDEAIDYLATKDSDGGNEQAVSPAKHLAPRTDESKNIIVYCDDKVEERYLSLDDLGIVLEKLSHQLPGTVKIKRTFNGELRPGCPNLILTPHSKILRTVLELYMEDEDILLPTLEEVLICNPTTTAEEINLLWQRAMGDPNFKRIFCLVHAEKLPYHICDKVMETLKTFSQTVQDYRLVIVCSEEEGNKPFIVSKLLLHKSSFVLKYNDEKAYYQKYLRKCFVSGVHEDTCRASVVDSDKSRVRVVSSGRSGMGKSLFIQKMSEKLKSLINTTSASCQVIPIHGPVVTSDTVLGFLKKHYKEKKCMIYHFDIAPSVLSKVDTILFSLLILRGLSDSKGCVWRCHPSQLYAIEVTVTVSEMKDSKQTDLHPDARTIDLLNLLPNAECLSPREVLETTILSPYQIGMDTTEFNHSTFQRVYQYLRRHHRHENLDMFTFQGSVEGNMSDCLQLFLRSCGISDPSWTELHHFAQFLDLQLECSEKSVFCSEAVRDVMSGIKGFVVKFMITMSRDFATPSLKGEVARGDGALSNAEGNGSLIQKYAIEDRRKWEESSHPYIFFNDDRETITFVGFIIDSKYNLVDPRRSILEARIMDKHLYTGLKNQGVNFKDDYRNWKKDKMIEKMSLVMGVDNPHDPDKSYVLTADNVIKILAIQMRFRCGIPVVIMGETGCGKTRLIRYMCDLAREGREGISNMLILKIHGGTREKDITDFVAKAEEEAKRTEKRLKEAADKKEVKMKKMDTVVFFDEANTTDAIGLIKEIMCDRRIHGKPISHDLKFIAACNPYRRHSEEMIETLKKAGLGYFVRASTTQERLGHIPLRELVYRVFDLPPSMRPLVYDFGQLKKDTEDEYIQQIVFDHVTSHTTLSKEDPAVIPAIVGVLAASQAYMRKRDDECSFVSLRDVERAMIVFKYFYERIPNFHQADKYQVIKHDHPDNITCALILAVSVCYHSRLQKDRNEYEKIVSSKFISPLALPGKEAQFTNEITWFQNVLLDNMVVGPNIARNAAVRENVFMMAICIELRIPLFLVGKPGSSKSLAKSIIQDSMHGTTSRSDLLQNFKQVKMFSYQCSKLATSESVIDVFKSAKNYQDIARKRTAQYVSVVVLDEVGLAEDSPNLPLKALHPLLEDGTEGAGAKGKDKIIEREERVAFIGISNWALDPAKMNRGVMVTRGDPDIHELEFSAQGICGRDENDQIKNQLADYFKPLAEAYQAICTKQKQYVTEFFGLRDFYSLIKMLYWMCKKSGGRPLTWPQMEHAIKRNFGGMKSDKLDPFEEFRTRLNMAEEKPIPENYDDFEEIKSIINPDCSRLGLIKTSLDTRETSFHGENRYLLFLTENNAALGILKHYIRGQKRGGAENGAVASSEDASELKPFTLFGSSFPRDKEYTQVCRNINQIKICMETGRTVILLNLENLYESLYDVLNQYYMHYGDTRYVDLGLQTHRVKCRVHKDFKLILIAERTKVYDRFPTPLINRLEKHFVLTSSILKDWQEKVLGDLKRWIRDYTHISDCSTKGNFKEDHAFIGYQDDTPAAVIFQASKRLKNFRKGQLKNIDTLQTGGALGDIDVTDLIDEAKGSDLWKEAVLRLSQYLLLQTASDDSLVRLERTALADQQKKLMQLYSEHKQHGSVVGCLNHYIPQCGGSQDGLLLQVTTHGHLLLREEVMDLRHHFHGIAVESFLLQEFDTELDFSNKVGPLFQRDEGDDYDCLLVIQCDSGHMNSDLIACARYRIYDERVKALERNRIQNRNGVTHVLFIINLPHHVSRSSSTFVGFQGDPWISVHIDDLRPPDGDSIEPLQAITTTISELFIGEYIEDIGPLMDLKGDYQTVESAREESILEDANVDKLFTPPDNPLPTHESDLDEENAPIDDSVEPALLAGSHEHIPLIEEVRLLEPLGLSETPPDVPQQKVEVFVVAPHEQESYENDNKESTTSTTTLPPSVDDLTIIDIEDDDLESGLSTDMQSAVNPEPELEQIQSLASPLQDMYSFTQEEPSSADEDMPAYISVDTSETAQPGLISTQPHAIVEEANHSTLVMETLPERKQLRTAQCCRLYNCIQAAASRIEGLTKDRSTQRVTCLTRLIKKHPKHLDPFSFHGIIVMHIYRLLKEREEDRLDLSNWVLDEALSSSSLEVGGTFRNVLVRKIDEVVIPIFAKIIASIDHHYNMDLINPKDKKSLKESPLSQFWLAMFRDPKVQQLKYSELVQGVKVTGLGGRRTEQDFNCKLPFFWLIKDAVDSQWDNAKHNAGPSKQTMHHQQLCELVNDTPVGSVLQTVHSENCEEFYNLYLHDFVKSVHRCKHDIAEHNALELRLISDALNQIVWSSPFQHQSLVSMIAALHLAYGTSKSQILWFSQLVSHSPGIMHSLVGMLPSRDIADLELHVYAAEKMMEALEPPLHKDNPNPNLALWINRIRLSQNTIDSILSIKSDSERVVKTRSSWSRLRAAQLFVEHVILKHSDVDLKLIARRLCMRWKKSCNFLQLNTVNAVQLQLNSIEKVLKNSKQIDSDDKTTIKEVKKSCRAFFMEVVSELCFKGQVPPETDLIKMLLDTVFMEKDEPSTQDLTPYKDGKADKIPTIRSFLLQLLLEHSMDQVRDHLKDYLERSCRVLAKPDTAGTDHNLYLLIIQCFEDALNKQLSSQHLTPAARVQEVTRQLLQGYSALQEHQRCGTPNLEYLEGVAKVRYSLSFVAEVIKNGEGFVDLLRAAGRMCSDHEVNCIDPSGSRDTVGPAIYLLKLLVRRYGMPCLKAAAETYDWIVPAELQSDEEKSVDPFVVYGDPYKSLREAINGMMYGNEMDKLVKVTRDLNSSEVVYLLMALFEKATLSRTSEKTAIRISDDALETLDNFVKGYPLFSNELRLMARALLANQQGGRVLQQMYVSPEQPLKCQTILGVVVHSAAVFIKRRNVDILLPFVNMLGNPAVLNQSFLPTMQEDTLAESHSVLLKQEKTGQFYECPNGHRYFIGNCGRAYHSGVCNVCRAPIGGVSGKPSEGNKLTNTQDTTKPGHDLGAPENRTSPTPERSLSARAVCIVRALMHSAFIWASCNNEPSVEAIAGLVKPQVTTNLQEFFWAHLEKDIELLSRDTGRGLDEAVMIVHLVLRHILTTDPPIDGNIQTVSSLMDKQARKEWERIFNEHYIHPVLSSLDDNLTIAMDRVANDDKQDHDYLFYAVYEKVKYTEENLEPHLWTYRSRVTLEHLRQTVQEKKMKDKHPILYEFLQAEAELRATQYLPDIARLQQCLYDQFNHQLDKMDAKRQSIREFIKNIPNDAAKSEYREMINSVQAAWALVGHKLKNHSRLPVEERHYVALIDDDTQMEYLIPTTSEAGVCTTALVDFLTLTHNNFIETCIRLTSKDNDSALNFWHKHEPVPITHLHRCHLVDYEHQLPSIILSHCHYYLKVGRGEDVKYDHQALEKHILNRFIHGKPKILIEIPHVVYRKDIYTTATFADVRKKVEPQEKLPQRVRQDIIAELRTPDRLREALDVVEIVLGFLSSGGGKADKLLGEYIDKTLKMKKRRFSQKAKNSCQLKHALSLWETIAVELARQLCLRGQEPFDSIRPEFLRKLSKDEDKENQITALDRCLSQFEPDLLLGTLYEFIETYVKHCPQHEHDSPLVDTLEVVLDQYDTKLAELLQLDRFPASIKLDQAVEAWKHIVHYYARRH